MSVRNAGPGCQRDRGSGWQMAKSLFSPREFVRSHMAILLPYRATRQNREYLRPKCGIFIAAFGRQRIAGNNAKHLPM